MESKMEPKTDILTTLAQTLAQDASYISHLKLSRILKKQAPQWPHTLKVALVSAFTLEPLIPCLQVQCAAQQIQLQCYQAPYAQYQQEILNPNSGLYQFQPQLTLLCVDTPALWPELWHNPYILSPEQRQTAVETALTAYLALLDTLRQQVPGMLLVTNFIAPRHSELGILEWQQPYSVREALGQANARLQQHLRQLPASYGVDLAHWAADFGLMRVYDDKLANYGDIRLSLDFIAHLSQRLLGYVLPLQGQVKKCLVLDCDNTLWGGIVGEDGWAQLKIGTDTAEGRAYSQFQRWLLRYQQRGLLLAINSKNNEADVREVFNQRPEMVLKPEHFAVMRINWQDKAQNLREIAQQLNIGLDSLVFFDDSPQERAVVRQYCPPVLVPELATADGYSQILTGLVELNVLNLTAEDRNKSQQYAEQAARSQHQAQATDLSSYLHSLETVATIQRAIPAHYPRLAQLSQKTNQFNLTTRRYSEAEIQHWAESAQARVYSLAVQDKFGDLGLVGLAIWVQQTAPQDWLLDTLLLSCRCLGRQVEQAFMAYQLQQLQQQGITQVTAHYYPTPKNQLAQEFMARLGWQEIGENGYHADLTAYQLDIPTWIAVKSL